MRATREASGWKIAEPMPISAAENRIIGNEPALRHQEEADQGEAHAEGERIGLRLLVGEVPTTGCSSDAVHWKASVIRPTCAKVRP